MTDHPAVEPWYVLVADDDDDVLEITDLALRDTVVDGRPVQLLFASTEAQAIAYFDRPIAVAILDVIMDTERSGFDIAAWIRRTHRCASTRIVIRTGQPGLSDGQRAFQLEDINEFWLKTEVDVGRMRATLSGLIRSFRDVHVAEVARARLLQAAWRHAADMADLLDSPAFVEGCGARAICVARLGSENDEIEWLGASCDVHGSRDLLARAAIRAARRQPRTWSVEGPWASIASGGEPGSVVLAVQPPPSASLRGAWASLIAGSSTAASE